MLECRGRGIVYQITGPPQPPAQVDLFVVGQAIAFVEQADLVERAHPQRNSSACHILDLARPVVLPPIELAIAIVPRDSAVWLDPGPSVLKRVPVGVVD